MRVNSQHVSGPGLVLHRLRFAVRAWIAPVARRRVCRLETCDEALRDKFRGILELPPLLLLVLLAIWRVPGAPDVAFAADMANTPGYDQQDWHKINKEQGLQADKLSDRPGQTGVLVETFEPISRYDMSSLLPGDLSLVARQCSEQSGSKSHGAAHGNASEHLSFCERRTRRCLTHDAKAQ